MTVSHVLEPLLRRAVGSALPVRIDCWDGSSIGPPDAELHVQFTSPRALRRLLWAPNELGFARATDSGDVQGLGDQPGARVGAARVADQCGAGTGLAPLHASSALAFKANRIRVNQVLAVRSTAGGRSGMPSTRPAFDRA